MPYTVICQIFFVSRNDTVNRGDTLRFLRARGFFNHLKFDDELKDKEILMEFVTVPDVLREIEATGYYSHNRTDEAGEPDRRLYLVGLNEQGVTFQLYYPAGQSTIFIPAHNILSIHDATEEELRGMQMWNDYWAEEPE